MARISRHLLATGEEGCVFLFSGSTIYVAQGDGFCDMLDTSAVAPGEKGQDEQIWEGTENRVYCRISRPGSKVVYEVAKDGGSYALKKNSLIRWRPE